MHEFFTKSCINKNARELFSFPIGQRSQSELSWNLSPYCIRLLFFSLTDEESVVLKWCRFLIYFNQKTKQNDGTLCGTIAS